MAQRTEPDPEFVFNVMNLFLLANYSSGDDFSRNGLKILYICIAVTL